jgi:hypothetical protein
MPRTEPIDASRLRRLRMKSKFILSVILLVLTSGLVWAQFWKDYSDAERQKVGEAYWLAGAQYRTVGKTDKGNEYMALARIIYPGLDPAGIKDESLPSAAELLAQGRAAPIGAGAEALPSASINSFFLRFVGTVIGKDTSGVTGFLDGTIYLSATSSEVTAEQFAGALADASLYGKEPSDLYDLTSLVVARAAQRTWGEAYTLDVNAAADISEVVSIWSSTQRFYVHREAGAWSIFGYGQTPPPPAWRPQAAAAETAAAPMAIDGEAAVSTAIKDAFTTCMTALLGKDADGALACMSQDIRFLRLRQTVTREELKTSLLGSFDNADFPVSSVADVLDMDSLFVHSVASPVEGVSGTVYELNIKATADLSSVIPFWTTYQKYYFAEEDGAWLVFAIL